MRWKSGVWGGVWFGGRGRGGEGIWAPSIRYVGYYAVVMCDEELGYGGAHVAGGDNCEGCVGGHCGN